MNLNWYPSFSLKRTGISKMAADVFAKYSCTYCQEEIKSVRVKCLECCSFELCLQCFSAGAEIGTHKKDHPYQLIDPVVLDIFSAGWSAREELQLLNAIEHYSYGNWRDISQHIGTKLPEEARDEYIGLFLGGEIGRLTWVPGLRSKCKLTDLTVGLEDDPQALQVLPPLPPASKQSSVDVKPEHAEQLEYMPLRDEFEVEYDNEAVYLVSCLTFSPDDDELEVALKVAQVDMYNQRLRERAKRHRVVKDNQLISHYFSNGKDKSKKKLSREEKELGEKLRPLWKKQEEFIMVGVMKQRKLSRRLVELTRYRRNGLCRKEEIPHFEQERQFRQILKQKNGSSNVQSQLSQKKKEKCENTKPIPTSSAVSENGETTAETMVNACLLSNTESQLCSALDLTPTQYISVKSLMLMDPQLKVEGEPGSHILDHLVSSGWVASAANNSS